jgi:hypothetical protein
MMSKNIKLLESIKNKLAEEMDSSIFKSIEEQEGYLTLRNEKLAYYCTYLKKESFERYEKELPDDVRKAAVIILSKNQSEIQKDQLATQIYLLDLKRKTTFSRENRKNILEKNFKTLSKNQKKYLALSGVHGTSIRKCTVVSALKC